MEVELSKITQLTDVVSKILKLGRSYLQLAQECQIDHPTILFYGSSIYTLLLFCQYLSALTLFFS